MLILPDAMETGKLYQFKALQCELCTSDEGLGRPTRHIGWLHTGDIVMVLDNYRSNIGFGTISEYVIRVLAPTAIAYIRITGNLRTFATLGES